MDPRELNLLITAVTNHFYTTLSREDFETLNILVSELSKSMFSMTLLRGVCEKRPEEWISGDGCKEEKKEGTRER